MERSTLRRASGRAPGGTRDVAARPCRAAASARSVQVQLEAGVVAVVNVGGGLVVAVAHAAAVDVRAAVVVARVRGAGRARRVAGARGVVGARGGVRVAAVARVVGGATG